MKITVICPTLNAGPNWASWCSKLNSQNLEAHVVIVDSTSTDETVAIAEKYKFEVLQIDGSEFNHATTRNHAAKYAMNRFQSDILIMLTQDAILASDETLENLITPFYKDEKIGATYGRQLPHSDASPLAAHARNFNYGENSYIRDRSSIPKFGLKTAFLSNSCAAYRTDIFTKMGGFPEGLIFGEDTCLAAKIILAGYKVGYCAEAAVYHSHNYTLKEEFSRYFDIGVLHATQEWLLRDFGVVEGEGVRFAKSELTFCLKQGRILWMANSVIRSILKYLGYKLGLSFEKIPTGLVKKFSMDKNYWN